MVSEEQLEFSENGSDKKGLFKVFWRDHIKQYSCEMGVGNTTLLIGEAVSGERGQTRGGRDGCEQTEKCQPGRIPFTGTLSGCCHTESSGPHSSSVPRDRNGLGWRGQVAPVQPI